jgi:hypothetical protein
MKLSRAIVLLPLLAMNAFAISDNAGTKNGAFLKIPDTARGVVLGPAMVAMSDGSEALRWNPAALGRTESNELAMTHILYYQDVSIDNIAYAHPLDESSALAASVFYLNSGTIEGRDATSQLTGDFQFYNAVGNLGYGRLLHTREEGGPDIYVGGAIKLVQEKIDTSQNNNAAVDLGLLAIPVDNLRAGVAIRNLSGGKANFVKEFTGGLSYTFLHVFTPALAFHYTNDAPLRVGVAAEYLFPELENSVLRLGYQSHDPLDDSTDAKISGLRNASLAGLTVGAGLEYRPAIFKSLYFQLDYGMAPFGALGISHTITVKMKW